MSSNGSQPRGGTGKGGGAGPALCAFSLSLHDDPGTRQAPEGSHREAGEGGGETGPVDSEAS